MSKGKKISKERQNGQSSSSKTNHLLKYQQILISQKEKDPNTIHTNKLVSMRVVKNRSVMKLQKMNFSLYIRNIVQNCVHCFHIL